MKKFLITLLFFVSILNLFAQSSFNAKFTTEDQYACDEIVKTKNGHYFGFSYGGNQKRSFYYVYDKKLVTEDHHWLNHEYGLPLGFYVGSDQAIMALADKGFLFRVIYNYADPKIDENKFKSQNVIGQSFIAMNSKNLYYLNASTYKGMAGKNEYFSGAKYDIQSETIENQFENKEDKHKVTEHVQQRVVYLKNGNIVLFVKESKGKPNPISYRPDGFSVYLYDNNLNLLNSESFKGEFWYDCNDGLSLLCNPSGEEVLYLWARKVDNNKMTLLKISIDEKKIEIKENKLVHKEIETTLMNKDINQESYDEIFKLLVTQMPVDKYQENPGTGYYLDSVYNLGENTYINYHVVQNIKGELKGEIYLSGFFVLDKEGKIVKNYAIGAAINNEKNKKDKNQLDDGVRKLFSFYSDSKIIYAYTCNTKLKGVQIEAGKEITEIDPVNIKIPSVNADKLPWDTFFILPINNTSFILKAYQQQQYKDFGSYYYKKCDYTLYTIE